MKKESNKKMNPLLKSLIKTGSEKEKQVQSATSIEEIVDETPEEKENEEHIEIIQENTSPEKDADEATEVNELPEKKNTGKNEKGIYEKLITRRGNSEVVYVPIKISTAHNNLLKKISISEKVSMQDLLANIIDEFESEFQKEIKISVKKLLS